jgi:hypothetical protein
MGNNAAKYCVLLQVLSIDKNEIKLGAKKEKEEI